MLLKKEAIDAKIYIELYKMENLKPNPLEHSNVVNDFDEEKAFRQNKNTNL